MEPFYLYPSKRILYSFDETFIKYVLYNNQKSLHKVNFVTSESIISANLYTTLWFKMLAEFSYIIRTYQLNSQRINFMLLVPTSRLAGHSHRIFNLGERH